LELVETKEEERKNRNKQKKKRKPRNYILQNHLEYKINKQCINSLMGEG
jgi:hypothetical protein